MTTKENKEKISPSFIITCIYLTHPSPPFPFPPHTMEEINHRINLDTLHFFFLLFFVLLFFSSKQIKAEHTLAFFFSLLRETTQQQHYENIYIYIYINRYLVHLPHYCKNKIKYNIIKYTSSKDIKRKRIIMLRYVYVDVSAWRKEKESRDEIFLRKEDSYENVACDLLIYYA